MTKRYGLLLCGLCGGTSDVKVLNRLICIGAFDNQVLCFCVRAFFGGGSVIYVYRSSSMIMV